MSAPLRAPGMAPSHRAEQDAVVQIAITDTRSTAHPETTMNTPSSAAAKMNTARSQIAAVEMLGIDDRRAITARCHRTDRAFRDARAYGGRPCRTAAADAVHDVAEVPQLQGFSNGVGDQAGGELST